jgi:hypothetical protein
VRASHSIRYRVWWVLTLVSLFGSCAEYGPYHANTATEPLNSLRGPTDGRYKFAFIEFGDQGSALDTSQRAVAISAIREAQRPLLFVYIHGWMNNANSGDVCRFEHFIDMISRLPEVTETKTNVIGVYVAWRGKDLTFPGLNLLTFWNRKSTGNAIAAQNSCLATINELALAAREPGKQVHHCVLMGHSFGGLVLSSTISHSILDASSTGARNSSPWDMAVAFNPADDAIGTRQLLSELDYLYKYDSSRGAYVGRTPGAEEGAVVNENRPFFVILQSENDQATGAFFPVGQSVANTVNLHYHWDKVPVPGANGQKISEGEFQTHTPGNDKYLVNFNVVSLGGATAPEGLSTYENRAFEANVRQNVSSRTFLTSEKNDGHEKQFCRGPHYNPGEMRPATGNEDWQRWQFVYSGNAHVPCWIVRVPKEIIWGHGGLWSDNSVAMFGALYRMHFPLNAHGRVSPSQRGSLPRASDTRKLNEGKLH